jgi:hypothetical protein
MLGNLNLDYTIIDNFDNLDADLKSNKYDIVFTDENADSELFSKTYSNIAIITSLNSKTEIEELIKKYRG